MLASMKYRVVHLRLHYSTVQRLQRVQDEIAASTYSEVVRHLLQLWEGGAANAAQSDATNALQIRSDEEHTT